MRWRGAAIDAFARILIAVAPLATTPLWLRLLAAGVLDFGGGEKDLVLLIPWVLWSMLFLGISLVAWRKKVDLARSAVLAVVGASAGTMIVAVTLWLVIPGSLGVRR